jgi:hypothetical protein
MFEKIEDLEKYIRGASNIYSAFGIEFGKFALGRVYEKLTSPKPKKTDAFILGYYLPWLIFSKGLSDSDFSEDKDHETLFEIFTLESYVFEAATNLKLDNVDRDYVYNIKSNAIIEKQSISQKLSGENLTTFNLGVSLSESIITSSDRDNWHRCITEAEKWAKELKVGSDAERKLKSLHGIFELSSFELAVEDFALRFLEAHKQ